MWVMRRRVNRTLAVPQRARLVESALVRLRTQHLKSQRWSRFELARFELRPLKQVTRAAQAAGFAKACCVRRRLFFRMQGQSLYSIK